MASCSRRGMRQSWLSGPIQNGTSRRKVRHAKAVKTAMQRHMNHEHCLKLLEHVSITTVSCHHVVVHIFLLGCFHVTWAGSWGPGKQDLTVANVLLLVTEACEPGINLLCGLQTGQRGWWLWRAPLAQPAAGCAAMR